MSGRSPARLLAPLALAFTAIAFISVVSSGGGEKEATPAGASGTRPVSTTPARKAPSKKERSGTRSYTVKPGDTPSSIADDAGIPLAELLELNPDIDPQALSPGQKLKLGP